MVPTIGIEPTTYWLQNNCSANWAKSACGVSECGSFRGNENWKHSDTSVTGTIGSLNQTQNIGLTRRTYSPSVRNRNRTCITVRRLSTCHPQPAWPYRKWIRTTRTERLLLYQEYWHIRHLKQVGMGGSVNRCPDTPNDWSHGVLLRRFLIYSKQSFHIPTGLVC